MPLRNGNSKLYVTSDESMLYLGGSYGRRSVCFLRKGHDDRHTLNVFNSFSAELFKVDYSMFKIGRLHFSCNNSLDYFDN